MSKKKKVIYLLILVFTIFCLFNLRWIKFFSHLLQHQIYIFANSVEVNEENIISIKKKLTEKQKKNISSLLKVKLYAKKLFHLQQSNSFNNYVYLPRKELGWNITLAKEFSLEAKEFSFPIIGSFGYLGFFDKILLKEWKLYYKKKGFDVHQSTIGAYSTLGWFDDPLFSTYLLASKYWLFNTVFHEIAHEKLWIDDDTYFNEKLASFVASYATKKYLDQELKPLNYSSSNKINNIFFDEIDRLKKELTKLYNKKQISRNEKRSRKKLLYDHFIKRISSHPVLANYKYFRNLKTKKINNAWLIQQSRYSSHKSAFTDIFFASCDKDFLCFFDQVKTLAKCSATARSNFLQLKVSYPKIIKQCK